MVIPYVRVLMLFSGEASPHAYLQVLYLILWIGALGVPDPGGLLQLERLDRPIF